jgi:hypothetical protein
MKIYTEIIFEFSEEKNKYIEVSSVSSEYNGEVALCGGGDDSADRQAYDEKQMNASVDVLNLLEGKYKNTADPENSYFSREIDRLAETTADKREDAQSNFELQTQQAQEGYDLAKTKGAMNYNQMIAKSAKDIKRVTQETQRQASEARSESAESAFAGLSQMGASGLAGVGGRARKTLAARKSSAKDKLVGAITAERSNIKDALASAEQQKNMNLTEQASGLSQARESASLKLTQQQNELDRQLQAESSKLLQEQAQGLDKIRMEATQIVSSTISSFSDMKSEWGTGDSSKWDPVSKPFDAIDDFFDPDDQDYEGGGNV